MGKDDKLLDDLLGDRDLDLSESSKSKKKPNITYQKQNEKIGGRIALFIISAVGTTIGGAWLGLKYGGYLLVVLFSALGNIGVFDNFILQFVGAILGFVVGAILGYLLSVTLILKRNKN